MNNTIESHLEVHEKPTHYDLVGKVIGIAKKVHATLGPGFLESVYRNALVHELTKAGFQTAIEQRTIVTYDDVVVGEFIADVVVNGFLIVELKAVDNLQVVHEVQVVNYLTATGLDHGLLLNFGRESMEFRRKFRTRTTWLGK